MEKVFESLDNSSIQTAGTELVFGKIFDFIGFNQVGEELFRHLVISRLAFPLSKLKTIEYLYRYQGVSLDIDAVCHFLDKLNTKLKEQVEQIAFARTMKVLDGNISVVFYDMTTLYFEAIDEDDLCKTGFSKDKVSVFFCNLFNTRNNSRIKVGNQIGHNHFNHFCLLFEQAHRKF